MATKERQIPMGRRQQTASPSPKELRSTPDQILKNESSTEGNKTTSSKSTTRKTPLDKKLNNKGGPKKNKKTIALKLNSKAKRNVNQRIAKSLINTARVLEAKKLLKNGKVRQKKIKEEIDDGPPVLEPIFPIEDNLDKKPMKRRVVKNPAARKFKLECSGLPVVSEKNTKKTKLSEKLEVDSITETIEGVINSVKNIKKTKSNIKTELSDSVVDTIEGVISGFNLSPDQIKREPDSLSESSRSDIKPKKMTKKQKLCLLQKEIKKENIENALTNIGQSDQKVIDMLDLNVLKVKKTFSPQKRRHTIEKYPMGSDMSNSDDFPQLNLFTSLPSNNPKPRRKLKSSIDNKVINPYTTRPPARLLRNGKQRQLKGNLLGGLDDPKRRKKVCSDLSEISKLSEYESDSSFSDLSSVHGAENSDTKDIEVKRELIDNCSGAGCNIGRMEIKRSLSLDNTMYCTDTNSNVCDDLKLNESGKVMKIEKSEVIFDESIYPSPSTKVPEKLLLLDIMKQNFNETLEGTENSNNSKPRQSIRDSTDELSAPEQQEEKETDEKKMSEIISKIVETMGAEEFTATIDTTGEGAALVMQNGETKDDVVWENEVQVDTPSVVTVDTQTEELEENIDEINVSLQTNDEQSEEIPRMISDIENNQASEEIPEKEEIVNERIIQEEQLATSPEPTQVIEPLIVEQEQIFSNQIDQEQEPPVILRVPTPEPIPSTSSSCVEQIDLNQEAQEDVSIKESIFKALGLQSLQAAEEARLKIKDKPIAKVETYTGTLKTVIKLNRDSKKKGKNHPLKMTLQKNKTKSGDGNFSAQDDYKIMKEGSSSWKNNSQSSDTAGAHRKTHYSNRSNLDGSSEHTSDGETQGAEGPVKALVIPEKASSFSIHPERLCKDECTYCFGKFGLFDTPQHIAQIKSSERQDKILSIEKHLTIDSCLCDACYRHIDRKANTPSYVSKSFKRGPLIAPGPKENHCHVLACTKVSTNVLRRKWIIKMKKQICQVINIDLDNPGLHSIPICDEHYMALEHLMVCAMCKRRLARNHIHYIGPEVEDLNSALQEEGIPLTLADKPVVCKLCKCFATVILKNPEDRPRSIAYFFREYKRRLLHFNNIVLMDPAEAEEPIIIPTKEKFEKEPPRKRRKLSKNNSDDNSRTCSPSNDDKSSQNQSQNEQNNSSRPESPSDYHIIDYNSLIPSIAMECEDSDPSNPSTSSASVVKPTKKIPNLESIKNSIDITVRDRNSELAVQRLGSNPSLSVRQLFPGEEELGLQGQIDFNNVKETTPEGWEKCKMTIQYDKTTKQLWQDLQKPYGNQSSFLRHLILLEKYFRSGELELKTNSSQQSINYSESVQNRLRAYDNIPTGATRPMNIIDLNNPPPHLMQRSSSGIITSCKKDAQPVVTQVVVPGLPVMTTPNVSVTTVRPSPVTITQLNNSPLIPITLNKTKPPPPPGLISLLPGTNRPIAPLNKPPPSQKIKFPITKNWRPTLIPIDPSKPPEQKTGLVQVISGGKPYHITLEDYKKMCAIKRSFEMKQKRQEIQKRASQASGSSLLKTNKGLMITKAPFATMEPNNKQEQEQSENILDKLDQQVENLESKLNENKTFLNIPKIPKSLTVIPQTVTRKTSRPSSPNVLITQKPNSNVFCNKS